MTQKDYIATAAIIREYTEPYNLLPPSGRVVRRDTAASIARDLAVMFKTDNPRFRKDRFFRACGLEEYCDN